MWTIDKQIDFCYGHRVYVQTLNTVFTSAGHIKPKCRFLHGHQGKIHVYLEADHLNEQSMVEDFVHLGWLKDFVDDTLDHKFIIDESDPMFGVLVADVWSMSNHNKSTYPTMRRAVSVDQKIIGDVINVDGIDNLAMRETLEGYLIVNFIPTSENLCKWMFDIIQYKMPHVKVSRVDWWETPKSRSSYSLSRDV